MSGVPIIEVKARRRVAGFELDVDFASAAPRTVLFGPSGGGKSMTLRAIAGATRLDSGRIVVAGRVLFDSAAAVNVPSHARRVGLVPQGYALFPHLTVAENILYGAARCPDRQRRLDELLELIDLPGYGRRRPSELSGGQQQRVALARALAAEPELLLLDEPFSALDASLRRALREELLRIQQHAGVPLMAVTHDLQDAFELGDYMVVIDKGRVVQQGAREEVFYRPATRRAAELLGMRNLLEGHVVARAGQNVVVDWLGHRLRAVSPLPLAEGQRVWLAVRPAQLTIRRAEDSLIDRPNALQGRIVAEVVTPEGYRLDFLPDGVESQPLAIELAGYAYFRLGLDCRKEITVTIRPEALHAIAE